MNRNHHNDIAVKDIADAHRTKSLVIDKRSVLRRDEWQDKLHQLREENTFLKKRERTYEDKAKQLEAKLSRILSEKKPTGKEFQADENKCRILELEYQIGMLRDRLTVAKQQLVSMQSIQPKSKRTTKLASSNSNPTMSSNNELTEQVEMLLLEAKAENSALNHQLHIALDKLASTQNELETTKEFLQLKESAYEDELATLRTHSSESEYKKQKLADNIQIIRLQRDTRRASSWLSTLQTQCKTLETSLSSAQENNQQLESQLNAVQEELRECQKQNLDLRKQVDDGLAELSRLKELDAQLKSLQDENKILKEANEVLQAKATSAAEKARKVEHHEITLKSQLSQIEMTLNKEIQSKTDLYSDVSREKTKCSELTETLNELRKKFNAMEGEVKRLEVIKKSLEAEKSMASKVLPCQKMNDGSSDNKGPGLEGFMDGEEKSGQMGGTQVSSKLTPCEYCKNLERDLAETRTTITRLYNDSMRTKTFLNNQMSTNKECHKEIEVLSSKLENADRFHHDKLKEFMRLLEERAVQMLTLEKNLEVIKSQGTLKPPPAIHLLDSCVQVNENDMPKKENTKSNDVQQSVEKPEVEIFIDKFIPAKNQTHLIKENLFVTWEFDDHGTQYTPIVRNGVFHSGSTHKIVVENFQHQIEVQLHQAIGPSDCQTIGKGVLLHDRESCIMNSTVSQDTLGELKYKFLVRGVDLSDMKKSSAASTSKSLRQPLSSPQQLQMSQKQPPKVGLTSPGSDFSDVINSSANSDKSFQVSKQKVKKEITKRYECNTRENNVVQLRSTERDSIQLVDHDGNILISQKPKSESSPRKPILRHDQSEETGSVKRKKMSKKVTVAETVEERQIPSTEEEKHLEQIAIRSKEEKVSESAGELSGDVGNIIVCQSKIEDEVVIPDNIQLPIIQVQTLGVDSKEEVDLSLGKKRTVENFPTDSSTELEQSSGDDPVGIKLGTNRPKTRRKSRLKSSPSRNDESNTQSQLSISSFETSDLESSSADTETFRQAVRIEISHVIFNARCRIWKDPRVKEFYIEYRFLDYKPEELETPNSLPKPQPGKKAIFNFIKVFVIDTVERRWALKESVQERKKIRFTLVSEPAEDDTLDCEDIGYAYVPMVILEKEDLIQEELIIFDAENPSHEIGVICVSIQASDAIKNL